MSVKIKYPLWLVVQWILAPCLQRMIRSKVCKTFTVDRTGRWLDIGCGPRSLVARTLPGTLVAIDSVAEMLPSTQRDFTICACANAVALPFTSGSFDGVFCFGLLHHLKEDEVELVLAEMQRVARPGGSILLLDSVRPHSILRRPFAAFLRALDRGSYVRTEDALRGLLNRRGFRIGPRFTYSWTGLEGCWARFNNNGRKSHRLPL
ncbi:MAG: methyltransferase domain-containing protein [Desulfosporosinus sp.]|nr:methyltransferase domain-containing protein [Desulfosporosinus sp.]